MNYSKKVIGILAALVFVLLGAEAKLLAGIRDSIHEQRQELEYRTLWNNLSDAEVSLREEMLALVDHDTVRVRGSKSVGLLKVLFNLGLLEHVKSDLYVYKEARADALPRLWAVRIGRFPKVVLVVGGHASGFSLVVNEGEESSYEYDVEVVKRLVPLTPSEKKRFQSWLDHSKSALLRGQYDPSALRGMDGGQVPLSGTFRLMPWGIERSRD